MPGGTAIPRRQCLAATVAVLVAAVGGCQDGDGAALAASSRVTDPPGDVRPAPRSDTPQPPGIDLVAAELTRNKEELTFKATMADDGGEADRLLVVRLREPSGTLRYMFYAGTPGVLLCRTTAFCTDRAEGATIEAAGRSIEVKIPLRGFDDLPDQVEWEASSSGVFTANIDDTWNDFAPIGLLES